MQEMQVPSMGQEDPLEEEIPTHSSSLAWRIPWTEEPGNLQSVGWQSRIWLNMHARLTYLLIMIQSTELSPSPFLFEFR